MTTQKKNNVAFVIGHSKKNKGAYSDILKKREYDLWLNFSEKLKEIGDVFVHKQNGSYIERQKSMSLKTKTYDLVFELHFNSHSNKEANGCEALYYFKNNLAESVADYINYFVSKEMFIKRRNLVPIKNIKQRGGGFVFCQIPTAIVLEPFFGSNEKDCDLFNEYKYFSIICGAIEFYYNIKSK